MRSSQRRSVSSNVASSRLSISSTAVTAPSRRSGTTISLRDSLEQAMCPGYDDGLRPLPGGPADTPPPGDPGAGHRPLEGPQDQFVVAYAVESRPPETHLAVQQRREVGHPGDSVRLACKQGFGLREQGPVFFFFFHLIHL